MMEESKYVLYQHEGRGVRSMAKVVDMNRKMKVLKIKRYKPGGGWCLAKWISASWVTDWNVDGSRYERE